MSRRAASSLAWSLCALCVALAAASLILGLLNGRTLGEIFMAGSPPSPPLTVSFSVIGALIASHRPENPIGWIFLAVGFFYGLLSAGDEYAIYALLTNPGALPLGAEVSWLGQWIWAPGSGLILVFLPLLFPDGHPPSHRWRPVAWLGGLSIGLAVVSSMILLWPERGPALVTGDESPSHVVQVLVVFVAVPMMLVAGLGAVISLFVRFRRARGDERQQIKWFASAAALTLFWMFVFGLSQNCSRRGRTARGNRRLVGFACHSLDPHRYGHRHPALPPLRHRPHHQPHPRLRLAHGLAGAGVLRGRGGDPGVFRALTGQSSSRNWPSSPPPS